jgi:hypothetical protein
MRCFALGTDGALADFLRSPQAPSQAIGRDIVKLQRKRNEIFITRLSNIQGKKNHFSRGPMPARLLTDCEVIDPIERRERTRRGAHPRWSYRELWRTETIEYLDEEMHGDARRHEIRMPRSSISNVHVLLDVRVSEASYRTDMVVRRYRVGIVKLCSQIVPSVSLKVKSCKPAGI